MRCLVVNPDTENAWELPLRTGIVTLGRAAGNDLVIDHPSVAEQQLELMVMDAGVTLKNLAPEGGTLVAGQPVEETLLLPGQVLQVGEVWLRYEDRRPATVAPAEAPRPTAPEPCKLHPRNRARYHCTQCHGYFCAQCVSTRLVGEVARKLCHACSGVCTELPPDPVVVVEEKPFAVQARGAFRYPLQGDGLMLIFTGAVLFMLIGGALFVVKYALIYGFTAMIFLTVFGVGYLTAYLQRIITSTAHGEERMPDWPDITDFGSDVGGPFWQFFCICAFCFLPPLALTIYAMCSANPGDTAWLGDATLALILFSALYFPMAFLAVAMFNTVSALNPFVLIPSIMKVWRAYAVTIGLLFVILLIRWAFGQVMRHVPLHPMVIPLLLSLLYNVAGLYLTVVEVRILGLLYRTHQSELRWFT